MIHNKIFILAGPGGGSSGGGGVRPEDHEYFASFFKQLVEWGKNFISNAEDIYLWFTKPIINLSAIGGGTFSISDIIFGTGFVIFGAWVIKQFINPWWD